MQSRFVAVRPGEKESKVTSESKFAVVNYLQYLSIPLLFLPLLWNLVKTFFFFYKKQRKHFPKVLSQIPITGKGFRGPATCRLPKALNCSAFSKSQG